MTIYSSPPESRTFRDDKPTLLVCWWCTSFAASIILFRVAGRYIRSEKLFREDWLALACLLPLFIRMAFVHLILLYGTNNMVTDGVPSDVLDRRIIGSRLVLASRIFYAATLWMLKLTISEFFKRLTPLHLWKPSYERTFQFIRWFLLLSFIAVFIADLAECQPITNYWQVVPDPGPQCRQGYAQLITMGTANVITDLLLIVFPVPIIITGQMSIKRKLQLTALFSLSLFPILTTLIRIPNIIDRHGSQQYRSLWASVEILVAAAVANALVLGSFVRDRGVKKLKYKRDGTGSMSDSIERTSTRRGTVQQHWGSDEDLVRGLGLGVDPELRGFENAPQPRVAPMAVDGNGASKLNRNWHFTEPEDSEESDMVKFMNEPAQSPGDVSFLNNNTPRKVSFFDVGGLLDGDGYSSSKRTYSTGEGGTLTPSMSQESSSPTSTKKGSKALLQDLGGLLSSGPSSRTPRPFRQVAMELQPIPPQRGRHAEPELHDVGGLLR